MVETTKNNPTNYPSEPADIMVSGFQRKKILGHLKKLKSASICVEKKVPVSESEIKARRKKKTDTNLKQKAAFREETVAPVLSSESLAWYETMREKLDLDREPKGPRIQRSTSFVFTDETDTDSRVLYAARSKYPKVDRLPGDDYGVTQFKRANSSGNKSILPVSDSLSDEAGLIKELGDVAKALSEDLPNKTRIAKPRRSKLGLAKAGLNLAAQVESKPNDPKEEVRPRRGRSAKAVQSGTEVTSQQPRPRGRPRKVESPEVEDLERIAKRKPTFEEVYIEKLNQHGKRMEGIFNKTVHVGGRAYLKNEHDIKMEEFEKAGKSEILDCAANVLDPDPLKPLPHNNVTDGISLKDNDEDWFYFKSDRDERLLPSATEPVGKRAPVPLLPNDWVDGDVRRTETADGTMVEVPKAMLDTFEKWRKDFSVRVPVVGFPADLRSSSNEKIMSIMPDCICRQDLRDLVRYVINYYGVIQQCCIALKHLVLAEPSRFRYLFFSDRIEVRTNVCMQLELHLRLLCECLEALINGTTVCNLKVSYGTRIEIFVAHIKFLRHQMVALNSIIATTQTTLELSPAIIQQIHLLCNEVYQAAACIYKDIILFMLYLQYPSWAYKCNPYYQRVTYLDKTDSSAVNLILSFARAQPHDITFHPSDGASLLHRDSNFYRTPLVKPDAD